MTEKTVQFDLESLPSDRLNSLGKSAGDLLTIKASKADSKDISSSEEDFFDCRLAIELENRLDKIVPNMATVSKT